MDRSNSRVLAVLATGFGAADLWRMGRIKGGRYVVSASSMEPRRRYRMADQQEVEQAVYRLTPAGTQEVAELIGISRQCMDARLRALDARENIWSKKVGPTKVWMHPRIMPDPDPDRDTSANGVRSRIFGDIYRVSRGQPLGAVPHFQFP